MLCLVLAVGVTCTVMSGEFRFRLKRVISFTCSDSWGRINKPPKIRELPFSALLKKGAYLHKLKVNT